MASLAERRDQASARGWPTPQRLRALLWACWLALGLFALTSEHNQRSAREAHQIPAEAEVAALQTAASSLRAYQAARASASASPQATAILHERVLPLLDDDALAASTRRLIVAHQQDLERARTGVLATWTVTLLALLLAQVYLARRTRRLLQVPLLGATALVLALGVMQTHDNAAAVAHTVAMQSLPHAPSSPPPARPLALLGTLFTATLLWLGLWSRWQEYETP